MRSDSWCGWGQWNGAFFLGSLQEEECGSAVSLREGRSGCFRGGVRPLLANLGTILCPSSSLRERCWVCSSREQQGRELRVPILLNGEKNQIALASVRVGGTSFSQAGPRVSGCAVPHVGPLHVSSRGPAATALVSWPATSKTRLPLAGCSPKSSEPVPGLAAACWSCQDSFPRDHPSWALPFSGKTSCLAAGRELLV